MPRIVQATPGVEGYVFDGADGSQMAFWTCHQTAVSAEHAHEYDEYIIVAQGCYTLLIGGRRTPIEAGQEYFIPSITRSALSRQTSPRTSSGVFSLHL
ncbi:MAG: cupin [Acidobacteria bacterium]|nr:MAG: cupin [Acidobacteriota bacterium]